MPVDLDKLTAPFPKTAIKQRSGGGGRSLSYVEGHTVIHRLISATENTFTFRVVGIDTRTITTKSGNATLVTATVELTIPGLGARQHIGVQMVNDAGGEDLVKGAITDGLKKAATLFGVGLELYGPDYEEGEVAMPTTAPAPPRREAAMPAYMEPHPQSRQAQPYNDAVEGFENDAPPVDAQGSPADNSFGPSPKQIKFLFGLAKDAAIDDETLRRVMAEKFQKVHTKDLTRREASEFIEWLKAQVPQEQPALV